MNNEEKKMRKTPIKHIVHTHQRKTKHGKTTVHDYNRGHGEKKIKISNPRLQQSDQIKSSFEVQINYPNQSPEVIPANASNFPDAIEQAMMVRQHITPPISVECAKV